MAIFKVIIGWEFFPAVICFNLAYFLADFPLLCTVFLGIGTIEMIHAYYSCFTVILCISKLNALYSLAISFDGNFRI